MSSNVRKRELGWYGWRRDLPDHRDLKFRPTLTAKEMQKHLSKTRNLLGKHMPAVYDQGDLGSCTANAIAAALQYERNYERKGPDFTPSRLAIYYAERFIEGTVASDAGAEIRDGMKVIATDGAGPEALWPYDIARFAEAPPAAYTEAAAQHRTVQYERVAQTEYGLKAAIWDGHPVVFGISVFTTFETDEAERTGRIPLPKSNEELLGGHAMLATGYTATQIRFRNSWGADWGKGGYGTMPLEYLLNAELSSDFWVVKLTS